MERDRIIIKVADSGPGVPPEMRERIFDPFFTGRRDGFGIGLSLCHRIVSDHGGTLKVSESKWGGAEFHMEIPASVYWGYDSHG
jgi:signal transduction histidine kinase